MRLPEKFRFSFLFPIKTDKLNLRVTTEKKKKIFVALSTAALIKLYGAQRLGDKNGNKNSTSTVSVIIQVWCGPQNSQIQIYTKVI
jgi:hypothetical protein